MIPQFEPWIDEQEIAEITEVLRSNWITEGKKTAEFQAMVAQRCGVKHAIVVPNGTLALYVALAAAGVGPGDEVIVPDFTFIASANSVVLTGAKPVFVDVDAKTFNIDPEATRRAITSKTKAIMPVHIFGQSADMEAIMAIAKEHNLLVIEDAAQGMGVTFQGKPTGSFGHINAISFYADKSITTGEGGAILTDSDELARKSIILKNQGRTERGYYVHEFIGFNFRLTDLQAALGVVQMRKLDEIIRRKKHIEARYYERLGSLPGVDIPYQDPRGFSVYFRVTILVDDPEGLSSYLGERGIGSRGFFYPLHMQPCYQVPGDFPNSVRAYQRGLCLPSSTLLTDAHIDEICSQIEGFFAR